MDRIEIDPPELFRHPAFKRIVTVQGDMKLIFIAGQTPSDESYGCVSPGDYRAQYIQVMSNLEVQLRAAGATWDDVVYRRMFVLDVDQFIATFRDPAVPKYGDGRPPSTLVGVTRLSDPDFLIEIDLIAAVTASSLQGDDLSRSTAETADAPAAETFGHEPVPLRSSTDAKSRTSRPRRPTTPSASTLIASGLFTA
jgi:enamine deaminase RidA (YjgF/YER057c/UK114 family)